MNRPNIVFILADDMGAWAMGCAGNTEVQTPHIDALAQHGVRFQNFFCASPVCSPARASIVTGTMPSFHGVHDWIAKGNKTTADYPNMADHVAFAQSDCGIDYLAGIPTYIEALAQEGYRCSLSGKWHLGAHDCPKNGFADWYTIGAGGGPYFAPDIFEHGAFRGETTYITDLITQKALVYLQEYQADTQPFYLSVHYTAPHSPWGKEHHKPEFLAMYQDCPFDSTPDLPIHPNQIHSAPVGDTVEQRRENMTGYYAAISAMDAGIGQIVAQLKATGQYENTIIVFTADNGMNMGHHGVWGKGNGTYPPNMYDTSVKVPFIISNCPAFTPNTISSQFASHCDLFPTFVAMAEGKAPLGEKLPGQNLLAAQLAQNEVVICDEYGIVRMLRNQDWKFIKNYKTQAEELYHLASDPDEVCNLIDEVTHQQVAHQMREQLEAWFAKYQSAQCAGIQYEVRGRGQLDLCDKENAFSDILSFHHPEKQCENVRAEENYI